MNTNSIGTQILLLNIKQINNVRQMVCQLGTNMTKSPNNIKKKTHTHTLVEFILFFSLSKNIVLCMMNHLEIIGQHGVGQLFY